MIPPASKKIVLLGMMTRIPVAGVVWQTIHYLIGLERLGFEPYYVETHARTPTMLMEREDDDGSARAAAFIDRVLRRFGLGDRWAFHALHDDDRCFGLSKEQLKRLYGSAQALINLHGGTEPLPDLWATDRLVYLETDPVQLQVELQQDVKYSHDFLEPHCAFFTFAENYGNPDCRLPVHELYPFKTTRQPVVVDFWSGRDGPKQLLTTVGNWRQPWRVVHYEGESYAWSKDQEFMKFISLPGRIGQRFELALSSYEEEDRRMLEERGWLVRHALDFSTDTDSYRDYITASRGEFTVAKDQNVRLNTGWFSDRSATYLAAGRPVICQETGFSNVYPTGEGLFPFTTEEEVIEAVRIIDADYEHHCRAAEEIAREYFSHDVVLGNLLEEVGVALSSGGGYPIVRRTRSTYYPPDMSIVPLSRRPTKLPEATMQLVMERPIPSFAPPARWHDAPSVSVIVVTRDNLVFTRMCLESVLSNTLYPGYEIVVVDNASTDGTRDYLVRLAEANPHVHLVLNDSNAGFARACNQGIAVTDGDVLILLNNDTLVAPAWLMKLAGALRDPAVGLVGPVTNRIGNEAEVPTDHETWGEFVSAAARRARERNGERFEIRTLTMFCLAMRRDAYERIGPLDQRFEIGLLEDDDYSMRAHREGYRLLCLEDVLVHHFGESTFGKLVPTGEYGEILARNKRRYEEKWGEPWQPYERRLDPGYSELATRIRQIVDERLPGGSTVLVVSKGDEQLLELGERRARHFPEAEDGAWAGHHPADSREAVTQLERMREAGGEFLIFPRTGFWWLEHYDGLREHLESRYDEVVHEDEVCVIFALNGRGP